MYCALCYRHSPCSEKVPLRRRVLRLASGSSDTPKPAGILPAPLGKLGRGSVLVLGRPSGPTMLRKPGGVHAASRNESYYHTLRRRPAGGASMGGVKRIRANTRWAVHRDSEGEPAGRRLADCPDDSFREAAGRRRRSTIPAARRAALEQAHLVHELPGRQPAGCGRLLACRTFHLRAAGRGVANSIPRNGVGVRCAPFPNQRLRRQDAGGASAC